jgi:hypothetical protein
MKRYLAPLCLSLLFGYSANGQVVQWATKVIDFSSELTPIQYSANQALGKPNVLAKGQASGGQNPNAWTPDKPKRQEFLKLGYANPIQIQQIAIAESHNPSALFKVYVYDEKGVEHLIRSFNPKPVSLKGRMLNVIFEKTTFKVSAVKLEFDGEAVNDYFSIDAVAISDANIPIIADISIPELISKGLLVEQLDTKVNSDVSEYNPLLSPDGKTLYFSRKNHPGNIGGVKDQEDIWYSELDSNGKWSEAKNMGPMVNNAGPNFVNAIASTPDGNAVLVLGNKYLPNGKMLAGVSMTTQINGRWTPPMPLTIENDYNFNGSGRFTRRSGEVGLQT